MLADPSHERVNNFCRHFTEMTGWPMRFAATVNESVSEQQFDGRNQQGDQAIWQHEVVTGSKKLGVLRIDQPHGRDIDRSLVDACRTADSLVRTQSRFLGVAQPVPIASKTRSDSDETAGTTDSPHSLPLDIDRLQRDLEYAAKCQTNEKQDFASDCGMLTTNWFVRNQHEIGGDFCMFRSLSKRQTLVAIGDAAGNGVTAAMLTAHFKGAMAAEFTDELSHPQELAEQLARLNDAVWKTSEPHQFLSATVGIFDKDLMQFFYVNAGHPQPLVLRDNRVTVLESHGMMLGAMPESTYGLGQIELEPGDQLLFYTDGVTEAVNENQEMFRTAGLSKLLTSTTIRERAGLLDLLERRLLEFTAGQGVADDRSAMIVSVR